MLELSQRQQTAVAVAVTILAAVIIVCTVVGMGWVAGLFLSRFSNVFLPVAVGAIGALVFNPYYEWLRTGLRLPAALALMAVFVSILAPLVAFGWFFGALALEQVGELLSRLPDWWTSTTAYAQERWPQVAEFLNQNPWGQRLRAVLAAQQGAILASLGTFGGKALSAGGAIFRAIASLLSWVVLPVYFAFFLTADWRRAGSLEAQLPFLKPETRKDVAYLVDEFINIVVAFFRGQLIIALAQSLLYAVGFSLVGLQYGFILGLALGFLNIIPYLGSLVGLGIGLPLGYFQQDGGLGTVTAVLAVFTAVQLVEAYVLTPRIMGRRTGLHPMVIIVSVFFWGTALHGIMGMILAIPLTAFLVVVWHLLREKYIRELV